ncbi:MAG: methylmalonyl-CoA mutase [Chloroflexi bacterium]|nr:methylmalonyl-CoA mutase [Chloroflexota bacterium]
MAIETTPASSGFSHAKQRWLAKATSRPVRPAQTHSGLDVDLLYTPEDVAGLDYERDLGFPGEYPFTRGIQTTMYRGRLWTMRMYSGFGTAEDSNQRYRYLLDQGQTGLSVALDLPSQLGYDADEEDMEGEVGRVGVSLCTLKDMERLFEGIPLDKVSTNFTINATAAQILAMYIAAAEKQGVRPEQLNGTLQNDVLKDYAARGTWIFPVEPSMRLTIDIIQYCSRNVPKFNPISISAAHMREAGATVVDAVAFTFCNAKAYIQACLERGLSIDDFAPRLSFNMGITLSDFFEEVAKYRAARRLWARMLREEYGAQNPDSWKLRIYAGCGGTSLMAQEPLNNVIRVAYEAMSAVLGGVQALHTASYDEAYAIPTEESVRLALRTQQILAYETGVANTIDPLAGSYFVENLTNRTEEAIRAVMSDVEKMGGAIHAISSGYFQRRIQQAAYDEERKIQSGEKVVVGVNKFQSDGQAEEALEIHQTDPEVAKRQIERVQRVKDERVNAAVERSLTKLRGAIDGKDNLMPYILDAVREYATMGEITGIMRATWGEFREPAVV